METFENAARRLANQRDTACATEAIHIPGLIAMLRQPWPDPPVDGQPQWRYLFDDVVAFAGLDRNEIAELVIRKQHDYGHENILQFGVAGIAVRVSDKWARIENLTRKNVAPTHEGLRDSWRDIAGYALIAMMLEEGVFTLPLAEDA